MTYLRFCFGAILASFVLHRLFGVLSPLGGPQSHGCRLLRNSFLSLGISFVAFRCGWTLLDGFLCLRIGCCMQVWHRLSRNERWRDRNSRFLQLTIDFTLRILLFLNCLISLLSLVGLIFFSLWRCFVNDFSDLWLTHHHVTNFIRNPYFLGRFHCLGSAEGDFFLGTGRVLRNRLLIRLDVCQIECFSWHS